MPLSNLALVTLAEAKAFIGGSFTPTQDATLEGMIDSASELILRETGREFTPQTNDSARSVAYEGGGIVWFSPWDIRDVTSIAVGDTELVADEDFILLPPGKRDGVWTGARLSTNIVIDTAPLGVAVVTVTGDWGWPTVPKQVKRACLRIVDTWYAVDGPAYAEEYGQEPPVAGGMIPMDVWGVINAYRRPGI